MKAEREQSNLEKEQLKQQIIELKAQLKSNPKIKDLKSQVEKA